MSARPSMSSSWPQAGTGLDERASMRTWSSVASRRGAGRPWPRAAPATGRRRPRPSPATSAATTPSGPAPSFEEACHVTAPRHLVVPRTGISVERTARDFYTVGEVARVCLRGRGEALLTIEREGVLRHERHLLSDLGK